MSCEGREGSGGRRGRGGGGGWAACVGPALLVLAAAAPWEAGSPEGTDVTTRPERPVQGSLFVLRVAPEAGRSIRAVLGEAAGEELHFTPVEGAGADAVAWESLAAMPVDAGVHLTVRLDVAYEDGSRAVVEHAVPVAPGAFDHEELTVAPEFGSPLSEEARERLARDRAKAREVARRAHATPRVWTGRVVLPRDEGVTSGFGNGRIFNGRVSSRHMGLDLRGSRGDTVVAAARGVVELVDSFLLAGNIVYLNHGGGLLSGYFHLSEQLVAEGQTVEAGTPIGRVGASGRVTGPHLHWVVRYGRTSVDPRSLLELAGGG